MFHVPRMTSQVTVHLSYYKDTSVMCLPQVSRTVILVTSLPGLIFKEVLPTLNHMRNITWLFLLRMWENKKMMRCNDLNIRLQRKQRLKFSVTWLKKLLNSTRALFIFILSCPSENTFGFFLFFPSEPVDLPKYPHYPLSGSLST